MPVPNRPRRRPGHGALPELPYGRSNINAANDIAGSQVGSQQRQAPGHNKPSAIAGERHVGLLPATSGDGPGLIHTEEVTGSIPVSPTQLTGTAGAGPGRQLNECVASAQVGQYQQGLPAG